MVSTFTLNLVLSVYKGVPGQLSSGGLINFGRFGVDYQLCRLCVSCLILRVKETLVVWLNGNSLVTIKLLYARPRPVESHAGPRKPLSGGHITTSFRRCRYRDAEDVESVEREET